MFVRKGNIAVNREHHDLPGTPRISRRNLLVGSAGALALLPFTKAGATDIDIEASPILEVLRILPNRPGPNGEDFTTSHAGNDALRRIVPTEAPDMYWDPAGEDYFTIFGLYDTWITIRGGQEGGAVWLMGDTYDAESSEETLLSNGWVTTDEDLRLMQYSGNDDDRRSLAASLNLLGVEIESGNWDWVALPDARAVVLGSDGDLVQQMANRIKFYPYMETAEENFHRINYLLPIDTYQMSLLPPQSLPVQGAQATFIARCWRDDDRLVESIGLRMESSDEAIEMLETIQSRLGTETSSITGLPYADFLSIEATKDVYGACRVDFIDATGEWDVRKAFDADDLRMLPLDESLGQ